MTMTANESESAPDDDDKPKRTSVINWCCLVAMVAVLSVLTQRGVAARAAQLGSSAFPGWMWKLYDHKVWPLTLLPRGTWLGPKP